MALRQRQRAPDDRPSERREGVGGQPAHRLAAVVALPEHEADGVEAVREVVTDDREEDEQPRRGVEVEREADAEPVHEAVEREARRAERAHRGVRARLLLLVAVVEDEHALGQEEEQEARAGDGGRAPGAADRVERLGQDVEQRHRDDDAAGQGDQRLEVAMEPQGEQAAEQRRDDGDARERNCEPGHAARF